MHFPQEFESRRRSGIARSVAAAAIFALPLLSFTASAQTGGEGGVAGTVVDATGAAIPNATVTVINDATGVKATRTTTGDGLFSISPILPGVYTVTVKANGFSTTTQKNLTVNALVMTPVTVNMQVGGSDQEVTVTAAPPALETSNATIGLTLENETYSNLPLQTTSGGMRDPTSFGTLTPGAQGGTRLPVVGGTGNYLGQLYLDGLPAETINQQGDNRVVSQAMSVDAVDQMQVVTSTPPAEYSGAGAENFTMKSGGLKYHGQVSDFVRNTAFDSWNFSQSKANNARKPPEHQNELSTSVGGHVPGTKRVFFFVAYDRFKSSTVTSAATYTVPTAAEKAGDFSALGVNIYNPLTNACVGTTCTRQQFSGTSAAGVANTPNVIPTQYISPISKAMQQWLPDPNNGTGLANNYVASLGKGFNNHAIDWRVDFDVNEKHRISTVGAMGAVNYLNNFGAPYLPQPYTGGDLAAIFPKVYDVEDAYTISNSLVNQFKFGFVRFFMNIQDSTQNTQYALKNLGVTDLPAGQGGDNFPLTSFGATTGTTAITNWKSSAANTQVTAPNNYTIVDNLQWVKGAHSFTFGISAQWQQINNANPTSASGPLTLPYTNYATATYTGTSLNSSTGFSYASFLLGAVGGSPTLALQPGISEEGGRYHPIAPYVEDNWKVSKKLTVDAGLRWDYLPPYHEVLDRWSFLNPNITNSLTGTPGALQFAGNYGGSGVSCGCRTPVQTYWKNWGPRVGLTYAATDKTVIRVGAGRVFSQGGGVGGRGGSFQGTGQLGFNPANATPAQNETTSGVGASPSFYLNGNSALGAAANTDLFGKGYIYPVAPTIGPASQTLNTGFYLNSAGNFVNGSAVSYADPYFSGRAPDVMFFNAGIQQALTQNTILAINYVGNESHHLLTSGNNARGYWSNQLDPKYLVLGSLLTSQANATNIAAAQKIIPGLTFSNSYQQAGAKSSSATIAQGLVAFPQYTAASANGAGVTDLWGTNVGNNAYHSLQVTLTQRLSHGLTYNFNYTWSKNIGDDGTFRSGFDIPASAMSRPYFTGTIHQDRIERGYTSIASPHVFNLFGVYELPFGKTIGHDNWAVRTLAGGWSISGIFKYTSGTPVAVTYNTCTYGNASNNPMGGTCMPDLAPGYNGTARINGGAGQGPNGRQAANLGTVKYIDSNAFAAPLSNGTVQLIGNAPRTRAYGLVNPAFTETDLSVRRTFPVYKDVKFVFEVDGINVANHANFGAINAVYGATTFGTISSMSGSYVPRDFQFAGHINF